ncbi:hypothetical protein Tdes44962_MAKER02955 [Teratosphaeria destructans]|uniref:DUF7730 domain-containing protein n=1 Tax=Teratosphaeria destructans TaxID=418781 RepID=A0A9W7SRB3_9PEZI|nr:hypothetical protein Tdes44962_MAKER02955 [Teratosphaeria destructans]
MKPRFPLLRLPIELRQEIFSYLLPRTKDFLYSNPLASHARNFAAVQKRSQKGMVLPQAAPSSSRRAGLNGSSNVVWQRGNTKLLCVCRQIHDECADMIYGGNTFLLFVTYNEIVFRLQWLLPSGMAPSARKPFLDLLPQRYLRLIKRVTIHIDHVDPYTGMIKFNVSGKGLAHGLRRQVQRLVNALKDDVASHDSGELEAAEARRRLARVHIRVSNSNEVLDSIKSDAVRQREGGIRVNDDVEEMLAPFRQLYGVREVSVRGAVSKDFAGDLEQRMTSTEQPLEVIKDVDVEDGGLNTPAPGVCVYGNDIA